MFRGCSAFIKYGEPGDIIDADFREYYNLDVFEELDKDILRTYGLIGNLPKTSRLSEMELGGEYIGFKQLVLIKIEFWLHSWVYAHSDEAKKKINKPTAMIPDYIKNAQKSIEEQEESMLVPEAIREYILGGEFN